MGSSNFESKLQSSNGMSFAQNLKHSAKQNDLTIVQEELIVEDGCENELENNRQTIQGIRQSRAQELSIVVEEPKKGGSSENTSKRKSKSGSKGSKSGSNNSQENNSYDQEVVGPESHQGPTDQLSTEKEMQKLFVQSTGEDLFSHLEEHN